jgi:hypothetical protein
MLIERMLGPAVAAVGTAIMLRPALGALQGSVTTPAPAFSVLVGNALAAAGLYVLALMAYGDRERPWFARVAFLLPLITWALFLAAGSIAIAESTSGFPFVVLAVSALLAPVGCGCGVVQSARR